MEKTINGEQYYLPSNLTSEQEAIYVKIIDWKRKNITTQRGLYRGHERQTYVVYKQIYLVAFHPAMVLSVCTAFLGLGFHPGK